MVLLWDRSDARIVFDSMSEMFIAFDRKYDIAFVNRALAQVSATRYGELVGRNHWAVWPEMRGTVVEESYERAFSTGSTVRFEYHHRSSGVWLQITAYPEGDFLHVYFTEISAQKREEVELKAVIDSLPQIAWAAGLDRVPRYLNRRWYDYTGLSPEVPYDPRSVLPAEDLHAIGLKWNAAGSEGESLEEEVRIRRKDGQYRWHLVRVEPHRAADGTFVGYFGTSTDVHDLKTAKKVLQATTDAVPVLIALVDTSLTYRFCNRAYELLFDRRQEQIVGQPIELVIGQEAFLKVLPYLEKALAGQEVGFEEWLPYPSGKRFMRVSYVPNRGDDGEVEGLFALVADNTEARLAQEALKASEERFRSVTEVGVVPMLFFDIGGNITDANDAFLALVGFTRQELERGEVRWSDLTPPKWMPQTLRALEELAQTGKITPYEKEYLRRDGSTFWGLSGGARLGEGEAFSFVMDVTDRKRAEEVAEDQLRIARTISENADSALMLLDREGYATYANPAFFRVTGYSPKELSGRKAHEVVRSGFQSDVANDALRNLEGARNFTETFVRQDGSPFPVIASVAPLKDEEGRTLGGVLEFRDVTEESARERKLAFLAELAEATRGLVGPDEIMSVTQRMLGEQLDASRCAYAEVAEDEDTTIIKADWSPKLPSSSGTYPLSAFGDLTVTTLREGRTLALSDTEAQVGSESAILACKALSLGAIVCCPLIKGGRLAALVAVHQDRPRDWTPEEIGLVEMVAERSWAEVERGRAQRDLLESEKRLRAMVEANPIGVVVVDLDNGEVLEANDAWLRVLGYTREDLYAGLVNWKNATPPESLKVSQHQIQEAREKGAARLYEKEYQRADGTRVPVLVGFTFVDVQRTKAAAFVLDLSELKEARQSQAASEERYRFLAESVPGIVFTAEPNGEVDYVNSRWSEYFGFDFREAKERSWEGITHPEDWMRTRDLYRRSVSAGKAIEVEYRLLRKDGQYRWHICRVEPMRNEEGQVVKWFGTITDIHDQKSRERTLEITNRVGRQLAEDLDLERIVQSLTDASTEVVGAEFGSFFYNVVNEAGEAFLLYTLSGAKKESFESFGMPPGYPRFRADFRWRGERSVGRHYPRSSVRPGRSALRHA